MKRIRYISHAQEA